MSGLGPKSKVIAQIDSCIEETRLLVMVFLAHIKIPLE